VEERVRFYEGIGLSRATLGFHVQTPEELAHYARATVDILYKFPFSKEENGEVNGDELEGIAARGDFDLTQHEKFSGKPMAIFDEEVRGAWTKLAEEKKTELREDFVESKTRVNVEKKKMSLDDAATAARKEAEMFFERLAKGQYLPHVIEPSAGVDRLILALIANAYSEINDPDDKGKSETRVIMRFHPRVSPIKVAVLPLLKNKPDLVKKAREIRDVLRPHMNVFYDDAGSIGRRYARMDEAGTPFCVTVDFETFEGIKEGPRAGEKETVTIRYRGNTDEENGRQERMAVAQLLPWLLERIQ
jgi:glycyl-tRNA synthetase